MLRRPIASTSRGMRFFTRKTNTIVNLLKEDFETFRKEFPTSNVTEAVAKKLGENLHLQTKHPLNRIKNRYLIKL